MTISRKRLQSQRSRLWSQLLRLGPFIQGSLVSTKRICGKEGCACRHGGPKHPVTYLTWKEGAKTISLYVPRALESEAKKWASNYKKLKVIIQRLSEVQRDLLRIRED